LSIRGISLTIALALAVITAIALSYELLRLFLGRPENTATDTSASAAPSENPQFSFLDKPVALPEIHFVDASDRPLSLGNFRGRPVLLNIWATWCVPCRKEMPSLDRLQAKFDPSQFLVLTLSIDRKGIPAVKAFYEELGLKSLGIYVDQSGVAVHLLSVLGVPTTLFVDRAGHEVGRKIGAAEWDSPETVALLRDHMKLPASSPDAGEAK